MRPPKLFDNELEGQVDFFETYLPRVNRNLAIADIQRDYSDGVINGNILEFKLHINDLNAVLFQTIKYLSVMRIKGRPIPANILLISLNDQKAYLYHSAKYLAAIETIYVGAASKQNQGFIIGDCVEMFDYTNQRDEDRMIKILKTDNYTKIHLDENCIVGWGETYYRLYPNARKSDFIGDNTGKINIVGEIRNPTKFAKYIYPYEKESNERFRYLMDKLNDFIQKKNLGAFYTHNLYAEKSLDLVRDAISKVPDGNDYVIIDRCAGTGNLERMMTDDELSHTIVSTLEYYEYKVLLEVLGDKVRHIIPPTEHEDTFNMGMVRGADALSEEFINNPIVKEYINNPKCTNQLTLDTTNGQTVASQELLRMKFNDRERQLVELWGRILSEAKSTKNYNSKLTYGLYQIKTELNTFSKDEETGAIVYDYPSLNGDIRTLAELLKAYYIEEIVPILFEYEFLK